ncbi:MAG: NUDIX domain-containing protein [Pseudomonadota bacterium]|nr:NUDIX domain-containing protein [Pseudomonadota bacterium]
MNLSAGVVVVRKFPEGFFCLVLRAYAYWDFPKGHVEPGEDDFTAARREVEEETTIANLAFDWGHAFRETLPYNQGKTARYYLARNDTDKVDLPVSVELGRPEHDEFRWVSFSDARKLLPKRIHPVIDWAENLAR